MPEKNFQIGIELKTFNFDEMKWTFLVFFSGLANQSQASQQKKNHKPLNGKKKKEDFFVSVW